MGLLSTSFNLAAYCLRPLIETMLTPERVAAAGWFNPAIVSEIVENHLSFRQYELRPLWSLLMFQMWHALYIEGDLKIDHDLSLVDWLMHLEG
jgi:hypothetical protein